MTRLRTLFGSLLLVLPGCQATHQQRNPIPPPISEAGCFSSKYERIDDGSWLDEDEAQLQESKRQCWKRYNKCIKVFTKLGPKRYTVICGE